MRRLAREEARLGGWLEKKPGEEVGYRRSQVRRLARGSRVRRLARGSRVRRLAREEAR